MKKFKLYLNLEISTAYYKQQTVAMFKKIGQLFAYSELGTDNYFSMKSIVISIWYCHK